MAPSVEPFNLGLRKPKSLEFTAKISKVSDLKPYMLASLLGRAHQCITEQSVMCIGGELYELRKRAVQSMKVSDNSKSLELRLRLTRELQHSEQKWRNRMLQILEQGRTGLHVLVVALGRLQTNTWLHSYVERLG